MCEQVILSKNEQYIFISDGTMGINIVDLTNIHDP